MFGPHKGENVCSFEEAAKLTRGQLDDAIKKGKISTMNEIEIN